VDSSAYALVVPGQGDLLGDGAYRLSARCEQLLGHAAELAARRHPRAVVFTGWSPYGGESEASQMVAAWPGRDDVELLAEETAATTAQNAARTLPLLLERGITEATIVCTPLHRLRAAYFFRGIYGRYGIACRFRSPACGFSGGALAWEAVALSVARRQRREVLAELAARLAD
jgi:uncharacterized SAM-binding protein YcdF (DUF218 family)